MSGKGKKKDGGGGKAGEEPEPDEEEKDLIERELVISYLKSKLGRFAPVDIVHASYHGYCT